MSDLIEIFCQGRGNRFGGIPCQYYTSSNNECVLLKEHPLAEIFARGRCEPQSFLNNILRKNLHRYRYFIDPEEHIHSMGFLILNEIQTRQLTRWWTIRALISYMKQTVYCEVQRLLRQECNLPQRECRYCRYFFPSEKLCQYHEIPRQPDDRACREGFDSFEYVLLDDLTHSPPQLVTQASSHTEMLLMDSVRLLRQRKHQAQEGHTKIMYTRQYVVFCRLISLLSQGISRPKAIQNIATSLGTSMLTIKRDIQAIKAFLESNHVVFDNF